jgi:putative transposase
VKTPPYRPQSVARSNPVSRGFSPTGTGEWPTLSRRSRHLSSHFNTAPARPRGVKILGRGFDLDFRVPRPSVLKGGAFGVLPMPKGLHRRYGLQRLHFITCSCCRRLTLLASVRARNALVKILAEVRDRYGFKLAGYVIMPEHIHLLISEPPNATPSKAMQVLKQRVSRRLRRKPWKAANLQQLRLPFRQAHDFLPQFWQPRFYDFNVWSQGKFVEKLQYMHMNPLKRKLVTHPRDWPWSSFSFYAREEPGLVRIDPVR